jgi:hypothetical protein
LDCAAAGVDNSDGVLSFKKRKRTNLLNLLGAVGKSLPLPARKLSIAAKNYLKFAASGNTVRR